MMVVGALPAVAELPFLSDTEWLGYFVGYQNKKMQFGVNQKGQGTLRILGGKGQALAAKLEVMVLFQVAQELPDGRVAVLPVLPQSLETTQAATKELKGISFRGKVKGDAAFEVLVDEQNGVISLGGRMLDADMPGKPPLKFAILVKIPDGYSKATKDGDRKKVKAFHEKVKDDRVLLTWSDGKRVRQAADEPVDAGGKELAKPGITLAEVEFSSFDGKKIQLQATEGSAMSLEAPPAHPLYDGFTLRWAEEETKDPAGKGRLKIDVK